MGESNKWAVPAFFVTLGLLLTAVVIVVIIVWPITKVTLTLDDEHTAAWISHDNMFSYEKADKKLFRSGVVFQLGDYIDYRRDLKRFSFHRVEIRGTKGLETFKRDEFDWINIVGRDAEKDANTVDTKNVGSLYPEPNTTSECSDVDALENVPEQCLRLRRIDARFVPTKVITYWQGKKGYDVQVRGENVHGHNSFDFLLKNEVTVTVHKGGKLLDLDVGRIKNIRIFGDPGVLHGEVHDPGMGGRRNP